MTDLPPEPAPPTERLDPAGPPTMPRWVKVSLIVVAALLLLFLVLKLTGLAGQHGPGRHGADPEAQTATSPLASLDATPPA